MADAKHTPERADGSTRESYYGAGRQPWDDIVAGGFGAEFAAGSILKYLRRTKGEREKDIEKARWYFARLAELMVSPVELTACRAATVGSWLRDTITLDELKLLVAP